MTLANLPAKQWRDAHAITDWEFAQIGKLLCDHQPRDLALMVIRLQGQLEVMVQLAKNASPQAVHCERADPWNQCAACGAAPARSCPRILQRSEQMLEHLKPRLKKKIGDMTQADVDEIYSDISALIQQMQAELGPEIEVARAELHARFPDKEERRHFVLSHFVRLEPGDG